MHGDAGALARSVEAIEHLLLRAEDHAAVQVGGDAAHGVVGRGLDGHRLLHRIDAQIGAGEVGDVGQLRLDVGPVDAARLARLGQIAVDRLRRHVQMDVVLAVDTPPGLNLQENGPANDVAAGQVLDRRRVTLHEALALAVEQDAALAAHAFGDKDAQLVDARRVELEELHVFQRHAVAQADGRAVARQRMGVGGHVPAAAPAAGGEEDGLTVEDVQLAGGDLVGNDAAHRVPAANDVHHVELVEEVDPVFDALLVERLQDHVAGTVGGVAGAHDRLACLIVGVATEAPLGNSAVG